MSQRIEEIRAREAAATKGPWEWHSWEMGLQLQSSDPRTDGTCPEDWPILIPRGCGNNEGRGCKPDGEPNDPHKTCALMPDKGDREFIASAKSDIPYLLARVEKLEAAILAYRNAGHDMTCDWSCPLCSLLTENA